MSLSVGKGMHCYIWKELPISDDVMDRLHQLAINEEQPLIATNFKFEWRIDSGEIWG